MKFEDKMYQLALDLMRGTLSGAIKWSETADEDSFRTVLSKSIVRVERLRGFEDSISLIVLDSKNREIARYVPDQEERVIALRNLWEAALHSARDSESKLDNVLNEISALVGKSAPT